jgi:carboxypeptidase Taq
MVNTNGSAELYRQYKAYMRKIADIKYAVAVLQWDQETYMPVKGASFRAQQIATLSESAHVLFIDPSFGQLLEALSGKDDLTENEKKNVELSLYDFNKLKKLSPAFVRTLSETVSESYQSWLEARKANSFRVFEKDLEKLVVLKREEADYLGYEGHPYNALLNDYERGCTVQFLDSVFSSIQQPLKELLDRILRQPQVNDRFLQQYFPREQQWAFGQQLIARLGFDTDAGRQDISEHPFTTNFSSNDVRVTTRIDENDLGNMTWSCIHEAGHGLYEQGLPEEEYGLPLGEFASLSIHESQSRIWENNIARGSAFWKHYYPTIQQSFPEQLKNTDPDSFYRGINKVQSSLIRTEADELTYHFHVMIRYELEKLLIEGSLSTHDIPAFWNERYEKYLGIAVPDDKSGCLQDVHWSHGSFGYFPTYSLGSFYAAQFYAACKKQVPLLEQHLAQGDTDTLLQWLRSNIHRYGRKYTSNELCEKITGESLNISYFVEYALLKYKDIYHFQ